MQQKQQQQKHPHHGSNNNNDCNGEGVQHASYAQRAEGRDSLQPSSPKRRGFPVSRPTLFHFPPLFTFFQPAALELAPCCVLIFGSAFGLHIKTISFQCSERRVIMAKARAECV